MDELTNNNRIIEIPVNTQNRRRGRPHGTIRKEPGQTSSVHVPERVREWMKNQNNMRLADYVSMASNWNDRMEELTGELRLADQDIARLEQERNSARKEVQRLTEENADLLRTKARTMERLKAGDLRLG